MSKERKENRKVLDLLRLAPTVSKKLTFYEFLHQLKAHSEYCSTAPANFIRAIKAKGEVDIDEIEKTSPERARQLRMLKAHGIKTWKVFEEVRGSQRFVHRWMRFLENAAGNGQQIHQGHVIVGPPGSGKSMCVDKAQDALEGLPIYAVDGCPTQENPINLLTLLDEKSRKALAEELDLGNLLDELLKMAQKPCSHCRDLATKGESKMGFRTGDDCELTNLASVPVLQTTLSVSGKGISTWMLAAKGQAGSLIQAFARGGRGIVNLPEAFAAGNPMNELELLILEATENRRIPSAYDLDEKNPMPGNYLPLDACLNLQTNQGAWDGFISGQKDPGRFIRRVYINTFPYNTSVSEEVEAYKDHLKRRLSVPHIDPLALKVAGMLAVLSRLSDSNDVDIVTKMRLYDGEPIVVPKNASSLNYRPATDPWGTSTRTSKATSNDEDGKNIDVTDLWEQAGEDEGMRGLNMSLMLGFVSSACERALGTKHKCITSLGMIGHLLQHIEEELKTPGHSEDETKVFQKCKEFLKEPGNRGSNPGRIEKEYRRLLREQVLSVFEPNYEQRINKDFERYKDHALAYAKGEDKIFDRRFGKKVDVDIDFLKAIEDQMGNLRDIDAFRRKVHADYAAALERLLKEREEDKVSKDDIIIDWRQLLPDLYKAIAERINKEIAAKVERCLTNELELNEEERKLRAESLQRFKELGYDCDHCRKVALDYFKELQLWSTSARD